LSAATGKMLAEEVDHARIEITVKCHSVKSRWISAEARQVGFELRRTRR
jgi:hypothetical protein